MLLASLANGGRRFEDRHFSVLVDLGLKVAIFRRLVEVRAHANRYLVRWLAHQVEADILLVRCSLIILLIVVGRLLLFRARDFFKGEELTGLDAIHGIVSGLVFALVTGCLVATHRTC